MKKTIDDILIEADEECESANYHGLCGLTGEIYENVKKFVKPQHRKKVAEQIAETVVSKL